MPLLDELLEHFFLLFEYERELDIQYLRIQLAAHQGGALVVLDVAVVGRLGQIDLRAKALLAKVAGGELIRIGQKVKRIMFHMIVFQIVHHVCSVALERHFMIIKKKSINIIAIRN